MKENQKNSLASSLHSFWLSGKQGHSRFRIKFSKSNFVQKAQYNLNKSERRSHISQDEWADAHIRKYSQKNKIGFVINVCLLSQPWLLLALKNWRERSERAYDKHIYIVFYLKDLYALPVLIIFAIQQRQQSKCGLLLILNFLLIFYMYTPKPYCKK